MSDIRLLDGPTGPILENSAIRLTVHLEEGTFSLGQIGGDDIIASASTHVVLASSASLTSRGAGFDIEGTRPIEDAHGRGTALTLRRRATDGEPDLTLTATLYEDHPFAAIQSQLTNTTGMTLRVHAFHVLHGTLPTGTTDAWRFYKHGWQSWSPTITLSTTDDDIPPFSPIVDPASRPRDNSLFVSDLVAALCDPQSARAVTVGFLSAADQFSQVWLDRDVFTLTAASYADGIHVPPSAGLSSETVAVDITPHPISSLERYGDTLAREMGAVPWPHVPSGWCSWYHYFRNVSEDDILANLEILDQHRDEIPLEYVQVDDGFQTGIGDWLTPNEKFPHGMAWLANRIHKRGFKAGLWLAPFLVGANSRLFAEHPAWTVRSEAGDPVVAIQNWEQLCYALDCTRPEVIEWLEQVFRTVTEAWAYDYVKVDFIYAAAVEGVRHDPNVTRAQAYRRGLQAIRSAVGERFILGCGAPIGPSVGLVNGMRVGPDVAPTWYPPMRRGQDPQRTSLSFPATVNALRNTITRFWTHNRLWVNDPDCLLLRDTETALTLDEVQTLATVIAMSGGMPLDSDDLTRLSPERRGMLARLLPLRGEAAVPLDLFEREVPQVLWRADDGLLAVFNWADEAADVTARLPVLAARLSDFWTGEHAGAARETATFRLPPHASKLLVVQPLED
jgi:alpha-galactosidase